MARESEVIGKFLSEGFPGESLECPGLDYRWLPSPHGGDQLQQGSSNRAHVAGSRDTVEDTALPQE